MAYMTSMLEAIAKGQKKAAKKGLVFILCETKR
jgi:hypothetical protein